MQGVKAPEGELPEGQEKLAWAMRVPQRGEKTFSTRWLYFCSIGEEIRGADEMLAPSGVQLFIRTPDHIFAADFGNNIGCSLDFNCMTQIQVFSTTSLNLVKAPTQRVEENSMGLPSSR